MNRRLLEYNPQLDVFDQGEIATGRARAAASGQEAKRMELAAALLDIHNHSDLRRFLQDMMAQRGAAGGDRRQMLNFLQSVAHRLLPPTPHVPTSSPMPQLAAVGKPGSAKKHIADAARIFGMELEGLSTEDQEFEIAKGFVRFATDAVDRLATGAPDAASALRQAAQRYAPGLMRSLPAAGMPTTGPQTGRWHRQGRYLIVDLPR